MVHRAIAFSFCHAPLPSKGVLWHRVATTDPLKQRMHQMAADWLGTSRVNHYPPLMQLEAGKSLLQHTEVSDAFSLAGASCVPDVSNSITSPRLRAAQLPLALTASLGRNTTLQVRPVCGWMVVGVLRGALLPVPRPPNNQGEACRCTQRGRSVINACSALAHS